MQMLILLCGLALAKPPPHGTGAVPVEAAAPHEAAEGGGHEAHVTVTGDDDHDGTANWLDSDSEAYSVIRLGSQAISLMIVLGVLFVYARPAIADYVKDRALIGRKLLTDSANARREAQERATGLDSRLSKIEAEIAKIRADAEVEAAGEEARLVERAKEESARIGNVAERKIRDEVHRARIALRTEAVDLAVQLAESNLRGAIGAADQQRLAREFLESLKKDGGGLHG
jgi:F-type H+-transporting ATPase subunit b